VESGPARPRRRGNGGRAAGRAAGTAAGTAAASSSAPRPDKALPSRWRPAGWLDRAFDLVADSSYGVLLGSWLVMVLAFGAFYWIVQRQGAAGMRQGAEAVPGTLGGLATATYFSFVTATSVGFGDVVPVGFVRFAAVVEAATGLLLFGCVISKLVSRRQDQLIAETHRIAFEDRLGRVRTNLHLVLTELMSLSVLLAEGAQTPERLCPRMESAAMVFSGELRSIHDLLYRPQQTPDEPVLEAILASLAASLREFVDLVGRLPEAGRNSPPLAAAIRGIRLLAAEICGECVPREYAPELKVWMDRIQQLAHELGRA